MRTETTQRLIDTIRSDGRYPIEAYEFLHDGLEHTTRLLYGRVAPDEPQHVSGQELCEGLRDLARERWGALAALVLRHWNIHSTRDFGEMVYFLIDLNLMGRQESDRIEDFDACFNLRTSLESYCIPLDVSE
jgi:uncharacterized repeat protein (TIGR04138 family)